MELGWRDAAFGVVLGVALLQSARLWLRQARPRWRLRRRARKAAEGERRARSLLARAGFDVLDEQVRATLTYRVDGADAEVEVRADAIAERGGRTYLAEVKTGEVAPRPTSVATRRQLLEYAHAFDVDGVLLVDATRGTVARIELPHRPRRPARSRLTWLLAAACVGAWLLLR